MVVMPGQEEAYLADMERLKQQEKQKSRQAEKPQATTGQKKEEMPDEQEQHTQQSTEQDSTVEQPAQSNTSGWQGVLTSFGLNGLSDLGHNAGYILAMLPDILVGMFTGRTQSLGIKDNLMPIASIVAGLFVKNPLLKMTLIGMGGANLLNKAGHEELARREGESYTPRVAYRQYAELPLNPRIDSPEIQGNCLIASIDHIPVTISLPDKVVDAYSQGALPLSTLANAVLMRTDQMQQMANAQERFEEESQAQARGLSQR